ncbi:hypothetical protein Taro_052479 [Colocasia esculenta]|uniref:Protein kinase domain-containing protein n=1 Tax=Colocasia esculenta TaxID=4460 RepID=A0A843XIP9_COLES|nr:hypothetical protein [Colocasia esculenta]
MDGGDEGRRESVVLVVIVVLAVLAVSSLLVAFSYYCYIRSKVARQRKSLKRNATEEPERAAGDSAMVGGSGKGGSVGEMQAVVSERGVQVFTFKQLHSATGGFGKGNVVGHGSFGSVYRGVLPDGRKIAVKLMDRGGKQGVEEFKMEVDLLTRLRSPYLLGLLGYCSDSDHRLLVYEYMANGGLQEHLYPNGVRIRDLYRARSVCSVPDFRSNDC